MTADQPHRTSKSEIQSKRAAILQIKADNPQLTAITIAQMTGTSSSYVYNVLSKVRRKGEAERRRADRLYAAIHGKAVYRDLVLPAWYDRLDVRIVNHRTGIRRRFRSTGSSGR